MKIVFWSCMRGHGNVSSSMLATASVCALEYGMHACVLQTQYNLNNLQYSFFKLQDRDKVYQSTSTGMDALLRTVKGGGTGVDIAEAVRNCGFSFLNSKLTVYTQSTVKDDTAYRHNLAQVFPAVLSDLNIAFDLVFVDTAAGNDAISIMAWSEADVIVVCLPQEFWLDNFFFNNYAFEGKKVFYLVTDYEEHDTCNLQRMRRLFKAMTKDNSAFIKHCVEFSSAMNESTMAQYFLKNYACKESNPSYEFISSVKEASAKMLNLSGTKITR